MLFLSPKAETMRWNKLKYLSFIGGMVLLAAASRLLPHPYNFTPIVGIALFSMVYMPRPFQALLLSLCAYFLSDVLVNVVFYPEIHGFSYFSSSTALGVYVAMGLISLIGLVFRSRTIEPGRLIIASLSSSFVFYLVSNTAVWMGSAFYPQNWTGWWAALVAGIPFYQTGNLFSSFFLNQIFGDLFYTACLFGIYALANNFSLKPRLRTV